MKAIERQLRAVEKRLKPGTVTEIIVRGGLPGADPFAFATVGVSRIMRNADETPEVFRTRVRTIAEATGVRLIVHGGLPHEVTPLDVMKGVMHAHAAAGHWREAARVAAAAAPYVHSKLNSETVRVENDLSILSDDDIHREIAELERRQRALGG